MPRTLLERNQALLDRARGLKGLTQRVTGLLVRRKREQLEPSVDAQGLQFAPLAKSTLKRRRRDPRPLIPDGESSRLITRYDVQVTAEPEKLTVRAGWPTLPWVRCHRTGTRKMPKRDPSGFDEETKRQALKILKEWVVDGR